MLVLVAFAPPLLSLYVGAETASNAAILAPAVAYVRIRALSLPAALLSGVLSAALLGAKESLTPLLGEVASAAGDYAEARDEERRVAAAAAAEGGAAGDADDGDQVPHEEYGLRVDASGRFLREVAPHLHPMPVPLQ